MKLLRFAAVLCAVFTATASAQNYPAKPVRVLLGFPVGQATDVLARLVAAKLSAQYGQQFYVENRPGAAGIIATELAAKAEPDGYTLLASSSGPLAVNPTLYPKLPYDVARDFVVFAGLGVVPYAVACCNQACAPANAVQAHLVPVALNERRTAGGAVGD